MGIPFLLVPSHLPCGSSCAPAYSSHSKNMTTIWLLPSHTEGSASVGLERVSWSFCTVSEKTVQGTLKSLKSGFLNLFTLVKVCGTSRPAVVKEEPYCGSRGLPFLTEAFIPDWPPSSLHTTSWGHRDPGKAPSLLLRRPG